MQKGGSQEPVPTGPDWIECEGCKRWRQVDLTEIEASKRIEKIIMTSFCDRDGVTY